jgi:hypothetical protein
LAKHAYPPSVAMAAMAATIQVAGGPWNWGQISNQQRLRRCGGKNIVTRWLLLFESLLSCVHF